VDHGKYYYAAHVVFTEHIEYAVLLNAFKHGTVQYVKPNTAAFINLILVSYDSNDNSIQVIHIKFFQPISGVCY